MTKAERERRVARLRADLLKAQHALAGTRLRLVVVLESVAGGGRTETARRLNEWLDARGLQVEAFGERSDEADERPEYWRYWRVLPAAGRGAIFLSAWYGRPYSARASREIGRREFESALARAAAFEAMLAREDTVFAKIWLDLSKKAQKKRLAELAADPATAWRVTKKSRRLAKLHGRQVKVGAALRAASDSPHAPWTVVDAEDRHARDLAVGEAVLAALRAGLERAKVPPPAGAPDRSRPPKSSPLTALDLTRALDADDYARKLDKQQARVARLTRKMRAKGRFLIAAFEGSDAAGKGGAIRRLLDAIDARDARVRATAAPTDEERARPYLWRFWRGLPRRGRTTIYDRTWYGRVLVERVEGFCAREDWKRAYGEIGAFESELAEAGGIVCKFWLQITPEEQLRRFKDRVKTPFKQYKITEEDWRNRGKWDAYQAAAAEMLAKTDSDAAPWTLIEAQDKHWARVKVLKTIADRLEDELG